jgi:hypothetical protein
MFLKVLHIFLAFNVLLSSSGIMVFEHLCDMKGRTIGIFIKPTDCCQKEKTTATCPPKQCCHKKTPQKGFAFAKKPCCEDKSQQFKSNFHSTSQQHIAPTEYLYLPLADFACTLPIFPHSIDIIPINQKVLRFYLYKPPPQWRDIPVFVQNFRC